MTISTEILSIVTTPLVEITKCLKKEMGYLVHCKRNVANLKNEVENLIPKKHDVQGLVDAASRNGDVINKQVENWVRKVGEMEVEMRRLDDEVKQNRRCFMGWCPNCRSRYCLGKEAIKKTEEAKGLLSEGNFTTIVPVSRPAPPPGIESRPPGDFEPFKSTESHMNEVVNALKDENAKRVGVYGMGGVGKTTLVTEVGRKVKSDGIFKEVIMVTVSQKPNIKKIQEELAYNLGMKFEAEITEDGRAGKLMKRLKMETTVLVILDNLWAPLDLNKVGIPSTNEHKGCKILLTSRNKNVCSSMSCQKFIKIKLLNYKDSWSLFKKTATEFDFTAFQDVAMKIVRECGGLPLAIVTLAKALQNKDQLYLEHALLELKRPFKCNIPDMDKNVYKSLNFSYESIEDDEKKLLFLLCCLFEEEIDRHKLLIYGIGEGFFRHVDTLDQASGSLHMMVDNLKASSLLLPGRNLIGGESVRMHDLLREVARSIASNANHGFLVKNGAKLNEWPEMENLKQLKRISLMNNEIGELSCTPECPQIRTLLLKKNRNLKRIHHSFFQGMESLVVLDLSHTGISSLPTSISCLKNLRTLNLGGSELQELSLEGLEKLEVLILCGTAIPELPVEIGRLSCLKLLDLTKTPEIKVPGNTIGKLCRLEELYMGDSFCEWEVERTGGGMIENMASFAEIASLPALRILKIQVKNVECLSQDYSCQWKNLKEFAICADDNFIDFRPPSPRRMRLNMLWLSKSNPVSDWVKELLERTEDLSLVCTMPLSNQIAQQEEEPQNSTSILQSDLLQRLHVLTNLNVENCSDWKEVFYYEGPECDHALLSKLRKLKLKNLEGLTSIWNGVLPCGTLQKLEILRVIKCGSLCNVFSLSL